MTNKDRKVFFSSEISQKVSKYKIDFKILKMEKICHNFVTSATYRLQDTFWRQSLQDLVVVCIVEIKPYD